MKKLIGICLGLTACAASAVEITKDWKIVVPKQASAVIQYGFDKAAAALQDDLAEGAGLKLEIVRTPPKGGSSICLGADLARAAGFTTDDLTWFDNVIAERDGNLYFFGNDRARAGTKRSEWFKAQLPTVGATARFLHDYLGDRFCMPGVIGRQVGHKDKVVVPDGMRSVERPNQIFGCGRNSSDPVFEYGSGMRGLGLFHSYGGHIYPKAVSQDLFKDHPEYFALRNGKRVLGATPGQSALCISNPAIEDLVVAEMLRQYDDGAATCQLGQNDGDARCFCDKCRAFLGTGDDWNEKLWLFHRRIAERIEKLRPGKVVHIISYYQNDKPPKSFRKFPSNVMIELCKYSEEVFAEWKGYEVPHGFTVYIYFWGNYARPGFIARHSFAFLADHARRFRRNNVRGVYRCGYGELYGLEGPGYYVFNKLLEDPEHPVDAAVAEYCQAAFGPAAGLMQQFYDTQDARVRALDLIKTGFAPGCGNGTDRYREAMPKHDGDLHAWAYSPDTVKSMEEFLSRAEAVEGLSDKERRRLDLVRREFDYAKAMGDVGCLYAAYKCRPTWASFDALAEALEMREKAMLGLSDGKGGCLSLPDWPELGLFGGRKCVCHMRTNGRSGAKMGAPLAWNMKFLKEKGILPGVTIPETKVARATSSPTLDEFVAGTGAWAQVPEIRLKGVQGEEGQPENVVFRIVCDDTALYVGTKGDLPADKPVKVLGEDGPIWQTDSLDLFVSPAKTTDVNYHLLWSPDAGSHTDYVTGLITDPLHPLYGQPDVEWNGTWSHQDRRAGDVWHSVVRIPFADLGLKAAPAKGDVWRFNLGRVVRLTGEIRERLYLWSPNLNRPRLGDPEAMGKIAFE